MDGLDDGLEDWERKEKGKWWNWRSVKLRRK